MTRSLPTSARAASPDIIVIYTDDQGYGDMSALNPHAKFQTPHLDRLAREGITFTVNTPSCACLRSLRSAGRASASRKFT